MQLGFQLPVEPEEIDVDSPRLPKVRPHADAELELTFLRAALAWSRWRERRMKAERRAA